MKKSGSKAKPGTALRRESDRALVQQIRRLLALPPSKRTNFLRKRLPGGGSTLSQPRGHIGPPLRPRGWLDFEWAVG